MSGADVHHGDMFDDDLTLAAFARDLQDAAAATPPPPVGASLAAVLEGRVPATAYPETALPTARRPARRPTRLRWAVGAAAFGVFAGSLGVAGALPNPVQRQVSRMADVVGVHLPDGTAEPTTTTITPPPSTPLVPPATPPSTVPSARPTTPRSTVPPARPTTPPSTVPPARPSDDDNRGPGSGDDDHGRDETDDDNNSGPGSGDDEADDDRSGHGGGNDADEDVEIDSEKSGNGA